MDDSKLWHLHGKKYDLTGFLPSHPGGQSILIATRGLKDATPLFESYHAFANRTYIREKLQQYRVAGEDSAPMYSYDKFYEVLVQRARASFGAKSDSESVTSRVKANRWWWAKILTEVVLFAVAWVVTFVVPLALDSNVRVITGFVTGFLFISLGFNTMHDASHFAIGARNHWANGLFLRAWTAWALWSGSYWMTHHVVRHHAYTGHPELDPDTQHARPFIRKSMETPRKKYVKLPRVLKEVWHYAVLTATIFSFLPGMFVGQILSYSLIWPARKHLWKMPHPSKGSFDRQWWETSLSLLSFASHFCFSPSIFASLGFLLGCNIAYSICILPDHDTFESAVENHLEASSTECPDWGEVQVRHSSDFGVGFWGRAFGEFAGGINYQVVHHLFPGVSHVHFPMLTKIVEKTCGEFNVPFVRHNSLAAALWSVAKTFSLTMAPVKEITANRDDERIQVEKESAMQSPRKKPARATSNRKRSVDMLTGLLFGTWLTLCGMTIATKGRHLLLVPGTLVVALFAHWMMGAFTMTADKRHRFRQLQRSSFMVASVIALLCLDVLFSTNIVPGSSSHLLALLGTGMIGAELFALVLSQTFTVAPQRVLANTIKLVIFTVLSYRGGDDHNLFPSLFLCIEHALTLSTSKLAWASSIFLHGVAIYLAIPAA